MKVIINGEVFDSRKTPIAIVFETDKERVSVSNQILGMPDKEGARIYSIYPDSYTNVKLHFENVIQLATKP